MSLARWLRSAFVSPARKSRPARRLAVECLEARDNPSGGLLDPTFGTGGIQELSGSMINWGARATEVQPDGKVVAVGSVVLKAGGAMGSTTGISVVRMNPDGSLDTTFNGTGRATVKVTNETTGTAVALQPQANGPPKIVVGGYAYLKGPTYFDYEYVVARLNADGSPDRTFGKQGVMVYNPTASADRLSDLAVLPDGSILGGGAGMTADGWQGFAAFKLTPSGSLDRSFGSGGYTTLHVGTQTNGLDVHMAVTPAGGVVLSGIAVVSELASGCLVSLTPAGRLDPNFNAGTGYLVTDVAGPGTTSEFFDVAVQGDRIVVAGISGTPNAPYQGLVARYTLTGALDTTFAGGTGYFLSATLDSYFRSVAVAADGSIIVGGYQLTWVTDSSYESRLLAGHLTADGTLDSSFGPDGTGFFVLPRPVSGGNAGVPLSLGPDGSILLTARPVGTDVTDFVRLTPPELLG